MKRFDFLAAVAMLGLLIKEPLVDPESEEIDPGWFASGAFKCAEKLDRLLSKRDAEAQNKLNDLFGG